MRILSDAATGKEEYKNTSIEDAHTEYITVCQTILKRERDRLKRDLKNKRV